VGCWAHIRREFHKIYRSQEKSPLALEMINLIRKLYSIESHLRDLFKKNQCSPPVTLSAFFPNLPE
jgi:hypothetical protein